MKLTGIILGLVACQLSYGQGVFEAHQTDSPAVPAGGMERLGAYVRANLQLPIASAAQGLDGRVFVQGTVEPDGRMTDLQVLRSMSPEVDREVVRILSLYKAWKPAVKAGAPVRQKVVYPAYIRTEAIPGYDGKEGVLIEYFDKKNEATRVASDIKYRNYIPVDALGHARSNLLYQQKKGDGWKTIKMVPFSKDTSWVHLAGAADSLLAIVTSTKETMVGSPYEKITRSGKGELLAFEAFDGKAAMPLLARYYYPNGSIRRLYQRQESLVQRTDWYENGQIWSIVQFEFESGKGPDILDNWSLDGSPLVVDGQGRALLAGLPLQGAAVFEAGLVKDGKQEGSWTGRRADSTLLYKESYRAGQLTSPVDHLRGALNDMHIEGYRPPRFKGGPSAMYQFMGTNMQFPGSRPQGRVLTTFVVQPDGSLSEVRVSENLQADADREALRIIKLMEGKWEPALYKGRAIAAPMRIPINFQVN